ncbi:hypothetical protein [Mycetocola zhadangensis]|uniref:Uncharacterized protein n=1 Tax=Mycetocola zhadangensis TaxID=1164595 RepID=A0A3L7J671_9MICO|nr:hypothetical protein [Mycetocola zhadangensis]RLQ84022.1 hypothetical protein D9V28_07185 [Mycetocola zhadangensis]
MTLLAVGLTVSTAAGMLESQTAGREQISLRKRNRGYGQPLANVVVGLAASLLVLAGAVFLVIAWGTPAVFFISFVFAPRLMVIALHNRHVRTSQLARVSR